ncbi:Ubp3 associated protein Bre5 [compost metagenome]
MSLVEGDGFQLQGKTQLSLAPGEIVDVPVSVAMTAERPSSSSQTITFKIVDSDEPGIYSEAKSRFVAPMNR